MSFLDRVYSISLPRVYIYIVLVVCVWGGLAWKCVECRKQAHWTLLNRILLGISIVVTLHMTVLSRGHHTEAPVNLVPFYTLVLARQYPELYRTMIMNVFLFVPYGLFLPFSIPGETKTRIILTIMSACVFSIAIETLQYIFALGVCEIDDVIMNTLGAAIGTLAFIIYQHRK